MAQQFHSQAIAKEVNTYGYTVTCTQMFTAAYSQQSKGRNNPQVQQPHEKVKRSIICIEYYSAMKSFKDAKTG